MFRRKNTSPNLDFLNAREHFLPVRFEVIWNTLLAEPGFTEGEWHDLETLAHMLREHYHHDYHAELLDLKAAFAPFNPDRETVWEPEFSPEAEAACREHLIRGVRRLLDVSNYRVLREDEFNECLKLQPFGGLAVTVDTHAFQEFHVYYRGVRMTQKTDTIFYFWKQTRDVRELKRVFVLAQYKETYGHKMLAKLFRDVPVENLKIIAPEVRLSLPVFDRFKIGGTVFGGIFASLYKLIAAAAFSWWLFLSFLIFFCIALVKGVLGFFNSRTKCLQVYSSSLYHQNLSNNVGAVNALVDQAEDQEVKEAFLAYAFLYMHRDERLTEPELDARIERWLETRFHFAMDFEVDDALRKLREKKLAETEIEADDRVIYRVPDLPAALARLRKNENARE